MNHGSKARQNYQAYPSYNFPLFSCDINPSHYDDALRSKNLLLKAYHSNRYKVVLRELARNLELSDRLLILDVGCDGGTFIRFLLRFLKAEVIGVDPSSPFIIYANVNTKCYFCSFIKGVGENLPFRSDTFDIVTCLEVLEHSFLPKKFVKEIHRVLKPNGVAIFIVPNEDSIIYKTLWSLWKYLGIGGVWDRLHLNKFNKKRLVGLLKHFKLLKVKTINLTMLILIVAKKEAIN